MTPAEHYAEAERIAKNVHEAMELLNTGIQAGSIPSTQVLASTGVIQVLAALAQVHATLAQATDAHLRIGKPNASL